MRKKKVFFRFRKCCHEKFVEIDRDEKKNRYIQKKINNCEKNDKIRNDFENRQNN